MNESGFFVPEAQTLCPAELHCLQHVTWESPDFAQVPATCSISYKMPPDAKPELCLVLITHSRHALTSLFFLFSVWTEEAQCSLLNASITETFNCSFSCGPDCWKISQYPCLQVYVNLTSSGQKLLLYHTEETMKINSEVGAWNKISS